MNGYPGRVKFLKWVHSVQFKIGIVNEVKCHMDNMDMWMSPGLDGPARTPMNNFSIFLYSVPVHCEMREMPFLKCRKLFPWGMAQKRTSISFSPPSRHSVAHLTTWSLKRSLCSWCRTLEVKVKKISKWGRSSQNSQFGRTPWHVASVVSPT